MFELNKICDLNSSGGQSGEIFTIDSITSSRNLSRNASLSPKSNSVRINRKLSEQNSVRSDKSRRSSQQSGNPSNSAFYNRKRLTSLLRKKRIEYEGNDNFLIKLIIILNSVRIIQLKSIAPKQFELKGLLDW